MSVQNTYTPSKRQPDVPPSQRPCDCIGMSHIARTKYATVFWCLECGKHKKTLLSDG